jgi:hypothetical protein
MSNIKKYLITLGVGLIMSFAFALIKGLQNQTEIVKVMHILCDSFFITGVLLTGSGLLVVLSNLGAFEMLVYGMTSFIDYFRKKPERKYETFYDYHVSREKNKASFAFLLNIGIVFIGISLIFLGIYEGLN